MFETDFAAWNGASLYILIYSITLNEASQPKWERRSLFNDPASAHYLSRHQQNSERLQGTTFRSRQTLQTTAHTLPAGMGTGLPQNIQDLSWESKSQNATQVRAAGDIFLHRITTPCQSFGSPCTGILRFFPWFSLRSCFFLPDRNPHHCSQDDLSSSQSSSKNWIKVSRKDSKGSFLFGQTQSFDL